MADKNEMTFWDHLDDLRGTLLRIAAVYIVVCIAAFAAMPRIFDEVIMAPCSAPSPSTRSSTALPKKPATFSATSRRRPTSTSMSSASS